MKKFFASCAFALLIPISAQAASVDLSTWKENGYPNNNAGTWTVQGVNNDSVLQSKNGTPTIFFDNGNNAQGKQLAGQITVETTIDDDFVGFVLGYQDGEITSAVADFWLIDWKQGDQAGRTKGLALSHVTGDLTSTQTSTSGEWWQHGAPIVEKQRATKLGNVGWADNTTYNFSLEFTASLIKVIVDGNVELELTSAQHGSAFTDGSFGFYNFSQERVRYAGITEDIAPSIPLPASLPLLLAGFGALGLMRRRQKA
ncbi:VPLPA-CTERM sorting domain-containing protein [Roseovarius aestuariivivens]|uniref:VPLPA-CTERM sorting domain-containing protein n=1 Tax=Roseovarius aestuariivivens TaxID=1888910 RepID=UPI00108015DA|nr:VPLPA-CTERM sorting domain-containing protein [Roseovarius aestuariivivens]